MNKTVYLNKEFLDARKASISITDYGFLFGAGIYEVIGLYNGIPFKLDEHFARLKKSAEMSHLVVPFTSNELQSIVTKLVNADNATNGYVYIQITFGSYERRNNLFPKQINPTVLISTQSMEPINPTYYKEGVKLELVPDIRWQCCNIKSTSLFANLLAYNHATDQGFYEAVFFDEQTTNVTECASSNIFAYLNGELITPPVSSSILSGVTRDIVIRIAANNGIIVNEQPLTVSNLLASQEAFITSSTKEIVPVQLICKSTTKSNPEQVSLIKNCPGEITNKLIDLYIKEVETTTGTRHYKRALFTKDL